MHVLPHELSIRLSCGNDVKIASKMLYNTDVLAVVKFCAQALHTSLRLRGLALYEVGIWHACKISIVLHVIQNH